MTAFYTQAYLGDTAGSGPDHHDKVSQVTSSDFPGHVKDMFTLHCSLLSVQ